MKHDPEKNFDNEDQIPVLLNKRLVIFVGAYGSGKSEVAINSAIYIARHTENKGKRFLLADLDVINPFYRSADARKTLNNNGVQLIASRFANTNVEAPSVPPEISSVFDSENVSAVLDIGGEDMGARIVSAMKTKIMETDHELLMVINTRRPFTSDPLSIITMKNELENACGIKITGLVNNTNLLAGTSAGDISGSAPVIMEVSDKCNIPYVFNAGMTALAQNGETEHGSGNIPFLRMQRTIFYNE